MTDGRIRVSIFFLGAVALAAVCLRTAQTRSAAHTLKLEARWTELRSELWSSQTRAARLRTPQQIRERVLTLDAAVQAPEDTMPSNRPVQLATDRRHD